MDLVSFIAEPTDDGIIEDLSKTIAARGKELMLALLEHAVEEKYALPTIRREKNCSKKLKNWFFATDNDSLFSFENICEYLQINSNYLRQGLLRWKTARRKGHPNKLTASSKSGLR